MRWLVSIGVLAALGAGVFYLAQDPRISALFTGSAEQEEDPLEFLEDLPEVDPDSIPERPQRRSRRYSAAPPPEYYEDQAQSASGGATNQVSNQETARVLGQVLRARGYDGVSLDVTDTRIRVSGTVPSQGAREDVLSIIEKGRENRRVDASALQIPG